MGYGQNGFEGGAGIEWEEGLGLLHGNKRRPPGPCLVQWERPTDRRDHAAADEVCIGFEG